MTKLTKVQKEVLAEAMQHDQGFVKGSWRTCVALMDKGLAHLTTVGWGCDGPITDVVLNAEVRWPDDVESTS